MTGTSLDALDLALIQTDGDEILGFGPSLEVPWSLDERNALKDVTKRALSWTRGLPEPVEFAPARTLIAKAHENAYRVFFEQTGFDETLVDLVGVHGQTVLHERPVANQRGRTVQLMDAHALAAAIQKPIAYDFRSQDVAQGGQGAPLAPIYHHALAKRAALSDGVGVLNIGGVANLTAKTASGALLAFDTGPGNGMMDLFVQERGLGFFDLGGALAARGRVHQSIVDNYLSHDYFNCAAPKSLDRYDFDLDPVFELSTEDALATLCAFSAQALAQGVLSHRIELDKIIVCGGGRHNRHLMAQLKDYLHIEVVPAEAVDWRGDAVEAEAFAYLAARCLYGLPISFPGTTGVPGPITGGRIVYP